MPNYTYQCGSCGYDFSIRLKISERTGPVDEECPYCDSRGHISIVIGSPLISYSTNPGMNVSDNFTDRLKQIKKAKGPSSTIDTKN